MVADHDALRVDVPGDDGVHVPDIARLHVHLVRHVRHVPTRAGPVCRVGDRAAPVGADGASFDAHALHIAQEALCMHVRDRQGRDARQRDGLFASQARCIAVRRRAGRRWIAGLERQRLHAAALDTAALPRRAVWVRCVPVRLGDAAVVRGIGVQQHADRAVLLRRADGQTTEHTSITNQDDAPSYANAERVKAGEVGVRSVAGVDDVGVRGAGGRVRVEGGGAVRAGRIVAHDVFGEVGLPHRGAIRRGERERCVDGPIEPYRVGIGPHARLAVLRHVGATLRGSRVEDRVGGVDGHAEQVGPFGEHLARGRRIPVIGGDVHMRRVPLQRGTRALGAWHV